MTISPLTRSGASAPVPGAATRDARRDLVRRIDATLEAWRVFRVDDADGETGLVETDLLRLREAAARDTVTAGLFGLIKRGKSTILNALVGDLVSPAGVTPETAVPVHVEYGPVEQIHAYRVDGAVGELDRETLRDHTSLRGRARDRGITHVRWQLPAPVLAAGLRLVDTPGLDDAEADELFVQRTKQELAAVDLGIVTFLSPPTVGAAEMRFLEEVVASGPERVLVVANLYPQHFDDPTAREDVVDYVRRRVGETVDHDRLQLVTICAEEAWVARRDGDDEAFERSGGAALVTALGEVVDRTVGASALAELEDELERILGHARRELDLRIDVLRSEERMAAREQELRDHLATFEADLDRPIEAAVRELKALGSQGRTLMQQHQLATKRKLSEARSTEDVQRVLTEAIRAVEVRSEDLFRAAQIRITRTLMELDAALDHRADATLLDLGAAQRVELDARLRARRTRAATLGSAAVGGLVGAGAGVALVGAALGPIGLIGGALLAWRLRETRSALGELTTLRVEVSDRLAAVVDELMQELDRRLDRMVEEARRLAHERRVAFTADLRSTLEAIVELGQDPCLRAEALVRALHASEVIGEREPESPIALDEPTDLQTVQA